MHERHAITYARALRRALAGAPDEQTAVQRAYQLVAVLRRRGHASLLPRTIRAYRRLMQQTQGADTITIVAADESDAERAIAALDEHRSVLGAPADAPYVVRYDDTLIGGARITYNGIRIDTSYKQALRTLYHQLSV